MLWLYIHISAKYKLVQSIVLLKKLVPPLRWKTTLEDWIYHEQIVRKHTIHMNIPTRSHAHSPLNTTEVAHFLFATVHKKEHNLNKLHGDCVATHCMRFAWAPWGHIRRRSFNVVTTTINTVYYTSSLWCQIWCKLNAYEFACGVCVWCVFL